MEFEFCGYSVEISEQREEYVKIRRWFRDLALKKYDEYGTRCFKKYYNMDALIRQAYEDGLTVINSALDSVHAKVVSAGAYELDKTRFAELYYKHYCDWDDYYNKILDKYMDITLTEQEKEEYRRSRKDNRARWSAVGFGVEGAVKGSIQAAGLNLASGAIHGAANMIGNGVSSMIANSHKKKLFEDPFTAHCLLDGIYNNVYAIINAYMRVMGEYLYTYYDYVSEEEKGKANTLLQNLSIITENKEMMIAQILTLNPFDQKVYKYIFDNGLDKNMEIGKIAHHVDVDISEYVYNITKRILKKNMYAKSNETELLKVKKEIIDVLHTYMVAVDQCPEIIEIQSCLQKIDLRLRTYKETEYATRKLAAKAKQDDEALKKLFEKSDELDKNGLQELLSAVEKGDYEETIRNSYIKELQNLQETYETRYINKMIKDAGGDNKKLAAVIDKLNTLGFSDENVNEAVGKIQNTIYTNEKKKADSLIGNAMNMTKENCEKARDKIKQLQLDEKTREEYMKTLDFQEKILERNCSDYKQLCSLYTSVPDYVYNSGLIEKYKDMLEKEYIDIRKKSLQSALDEILKVENNIEDNVQKFRERYYNCFTAEDKQIKNEILDGFSKQFNEIVIAAFRGNFVITDAHLYLSGYSEDVEYALSSISRLESQHNFLSEYIKIFFVNGTMKKFEVSGWAKEKVEAFTVLIKTIIISLRDKKPAITQKPETPQKSEAPQKPATTQKPEAEKTCISNDTNKNAAEKNPPVEKKVPIEKDSSEEKKVPVEKDSSEEKKVLVEKDSSIERNSPATEEDQNSYADELRMRAMNNSKQLALQNRYKITPKLRAGLNIPMNEEVFLGYDCTLLGSGKNGFAITSSGFYCRLILEKTVYHLKYEDIRKGAKPQWKDDDKTQIRIDETVVAYFYSSDGKDIMSLLEKILA